MTIWQALWRVAREPVAAIAVIFCSLTLGIVVNSFVIWTIWKPQPERLAVATLALLIFEVAMLVIGHFWLEEAKFVQHRENEKTTVRLGPGTK